MLTRENYSRSDKLERAKSGDVVLRCLIQCLMLKFAYRSALVDEEVLKEPRLRHYSINRAEKRCWK